MKMFKTQDLHVRELVKLSSPRAIKANLQLTDAISATVARSRERIIRILPGNVSRLIEAEKTQDGKARRICDFLAGQTDGMVVRTYRQLFDAEFGSFRDLS